MRILILTRPNQLNIPKADLEWLAEKLVEAGHVLCLTEPLSWVRTTNITYLQTHVDEGIDMCLALGGDGTMIRALTRMAEHRIPVLGYNAGTLGFTIDLKTAFPAGVLRAIDDHTIEELITLTCGEAEENNEGMYSFRAVNDIVVQRSSGRMIRMRVSIDDQVAYECRADGVIIATPTGSTAYSLAAGGPILHLNTPVLSITPLLPQTLSHRPIIVPATSEITVQVLEGACSLTVDGSMMRPELMDVIFNNQLGIRKSKTPALVMKPTAEELQVPYYEKLRHKLGWYNS